MDLSTAFFWTFYSFMQFLFRYQGNLIIVPLYLCPFWNIINKVVPLMFASTSTILIRQLNYFQMVSDWETVVQNLKNLALAIFIHLLPKIEPSCKLFCVWLLPIWVCFSTSFARFSLLMLVYIPFTGYYCWNQSCYWCHWSCKSRM